MDLNTRICFRFLTSRSSNQAYATPEDNDKYLTLMRELTEQNGGTLVVID